MAICKIKRNAQFDFERYQNEFDSLIKHAHKQLQLSKPFKLMFVSEPEADGDVFCKTGAYSPAFNVIFLYVNGRHIKDILRSLAHEIVHHHQNCSGNIETEDKNYNDGYAQHDEEARRLEEDAFLRGNMLFRDWEDSEKSNRTQLMDEQAKNNPWAICTAQVGREDKDKFERCVKAVKKSLDETCDDEVEEASVTANVTGYTLPLGMSNDPEKPKNYK
tara:strand:- start:538 stop:1191 length:654 start_codon:yes stop_codon:yes gene_type:complete